MLLALWLRKLHTNATNRMLYSKMFTVCPFCAVPCTSIHTMGYVSPRKRLSIVRYISLHTTLSRCLFRLVHYVRQIPSTPMINFFSSASDIRRRPQLNLVAFSVYTLIIVPQLCNYISSNMSRHMSAQSYQPTVQVVYNHPLPEPYLQTLHSQPMSPQYSNRSFASTSSSSYSYGSNQGSYASTTPPQHDSYAYMHGRHHSQGAAYTNETCISPLDLHPKNHFDPRNSYEHQR